MVKVIKTTIYLLTDINKNPISTIIDALSEYCVSHPCKIEECKGIVAQIIHCKDNFSVEYEKIW